jgi:hypothetical protein
MLHIVLPYKVNGSPVLACKVREMLPIESDEIAHVKNVHATGPELDSIMARFPMLHVNGADSVVYPAPFAQLILANW